MNDFISNIKSKLKNFSNAEQGEKFEADIERLLAVALKKLNVVPKKEFEKLQRSLVKAEKRLKELEKTIDELVNNGKQIDKDS